MKTVCIAVGHKPTSGGAINTPAQISEYDYNQVLAGLLARELHKRGVRPVVIYRESYTKLPEHINETKADYCIELHCNANVNRSIKGTATLYWHSSKTGKALAKACQSAMVRLFGDNDRGIKPLTNSSRGALVARETSMPTVLLEPFFISNDESVEKAVVLREQYANQIADAVSKFIKGV